MNYRQYGQEDMDNYLKCYLLKISDTSSKPPPRRRRNLKTFTTPKVTVCKQKKEIKDQKTVISCLRKKIAFSKMNNKPISDLDQFLQLPRAICDADGIPEKGQKSSALSVFKSLYPEAFFLRFHRVTPPLRLLSSLMACLLLIQFLFLIRGAFQIMLNFYLTDG